MKTKVLSRKRIWEVDCWSLDAVLASSFDWRELVNLLQGTGHMFDLTKSNSILELQVQCLVHEYCHSENPISEKIENLLNLYHQDVIDMLERLTPSEVAQYVLSTDWSDSRMYVGLFWAIGSEGRSGFDCIRRRFHQRMQMMTLRKLKKQ